MDLDVEAAREEVRDARARIAMIRREVDDLEDELEEEEAALRKALDRLATLGVQP